MSATRVRGARAGEGSRFDYPLVAAYDADAAPLDVAAVFAGVIYNEL